MQTEIISILYFNSQEDMVSGMPMLFQLYKVNLKVKRYFISLENFFYTPTPLISVS